MVVTKKKIKIEGKEIEVEEFDTKLIPGSEAVEANINEILKEEDIENTIKTVLKNISSIAKRYKGRENNLNYLYKIGRQLQFVDKEGWQDKRGKIWKRMADNLRPDLFQGEKQVKTEKKRIPEFMYLFAKVPKRYIQSANLEQWHEILKFKDIYKDKKFLEKILNFIKKKNPSGSTVRKTIKNLKNSKILPGS
jgi:hypothetical protein